MSGIDEWIAQFGGSGTMGIIAALLLGLRHATDPDHLTAVSTLVLSDERDGARRAGALGLAWGFGHATTLFAFGLPVVLFRRYLPASAQSLAEVTIGLVIVVLAARLLLRWKRGYFHSHPHSHGVMRHAHPHAHEGAGHAPAVHSHSHQEGLGRSPLAAFGIGLVHGAGGSAGVGVLLMGAIPDRARAVLALALFAAATAASMAFLSTAFGFALARGPASRRLVRLVPLLGSASLVFGVWHAVMAVGGLKAGG